MMWQIKNYFDENRFFYGTGAAIILANAIFLFTILNPDLKRVEKLKKEYFSLRKEKAKTKVELKKSLDYSSKVAAVNENIKNFIEEQPSPEEITGIIQEVNSMAKKTGLKIMTARYAQSKEKNGDLLRFTISLPLVGGYKQLRKFIYNLEKMPYLMSIDDITITSKKGKTVSLSLKTSIYFKIGQG